MFASIPYLVVEYDSGKQKQCNFKREDDVDRLLEYMARVLPDIPRYSAEGERPSHSRAAAFLLFRAVGRTLAPEKKKTAARPKRRKYTPVQLLYRPLLLRRPPVSPPGLQAGGHEQGRLHRQGHVRLHPLSGRGV